MGEVYRADDLKLGQTVALKFLPAGAERGSRAARAAVRRGAARAPGVAPERVPRATTSRRSEALHFLSMEFVDGEDLARCCGGSGSCPRTRRSQIAREICAGLAAIHEQRLLHRDLKPANVMLDGRGHVRITDFGLAELQDTASDPGRIVGHARLHGARNAQGGQRRARGAISTALGLVLYELFTGKRAFEATEASRHGARARADRRRSVPRRASATSIRWSSGRS